MKSTYRCCFCGLYGLTYKENVDDTRENPTPDVDCETPPLQIVKIYDPYVKGIW